MSHSFPSIIRERSWYGALVALLLGFCSVSTTSGQPSQSQLVPLTTGWNLISFQVGDPLTPAQFSSQLTTNGLLSIWGYDTSTRSWQTYTPTNSPNTLTSLQPGKGYWVKVSRPNTLTLTGPVWAGSINLLPGWNLIGFPGLTIDPTEQLDLPSVFRSQLSSVPQIWRYDSGTSQSYVGYDSYALPAITDLKFVEPGKGYWVYSLYAATLTPSPLIALAADSDVSPLAQDELFDPADSRFHGTNSALYLNQIVRYAGVEDGGADLNHNGILDTPYTQDTLIFSVGVNQQNVTIGNVGAGLLNWSFGNLPAWLAANPAAGVTATEFDSVAFTADRSGLLPGSYTNTFIAYLGSTNRVITVILQVPTIAGDYRGYATAQRVNGKDIALGKVDLNLSMFNESENPAETRFRAVINRDKALLFPKDVFMNGVFYQGNDFSLTTSFESPAGDRNAPPYGTYQHNVGNPYGDRDYNSDGKLDNLNPFPFAIYRQVTLLGRRVSADRLEGTYIEAVENILPTGQVIYLEGIFALDRESLTPSKKSIYSGKSTNGPVLIGGSSGGRYSYTNTLNVPNAVQIQGVLATVKVAFPSPSQLEILLRGPTGITATLFRNGASLATAATFTPADFNGTLGQGDWSLIINWNPASGERGYFNGWELNLQGLETFNVAGTLISTNGGTTNVVSGANLLLAGSNLLPQSSAATNGTFTFSGLTENNYSLNIAKLGYYDQTLYFRVAGSNVNLGNIMMQPVQIASPQLAATPAIGTAPLNVNFTPLIPASTLTALGSNIVATWLFGDGSTQVVAQVAFGPLGHIYTNAGVYDARLTLAGSGGTLSMTNANLLALAGGPNTAALPGATNFIFGTAFIGSFAAPLATNNVIELTGTNIVYQESKRDMAAFDTDRFPFIASGAFHPTAEDSDFDPAGFQTYTPPTVNGVPTPERFRLICTMGGYVFGEAPSRVGDFVLQAGRIEE